MIKKLIFLTILSLSFMIHVPALSAQETRSVMPLDRACEIQPNSTLCRDNKKQEHGNNSIYGPNGILTRIIRLISILVGIAATIAIIIGGLRYSLASGDPANVTKARNTITYALVGIVVAAAAQGIVIFVLDSL